MDVGWTLMPSPTISSLALTKSYGVLFQEYRTLYINPIRAGTSLLQLLGIFSLREVFRGL